MKLGSRSRSGIQSEPNAETKDVNEGIVKGASTTMSLGLRSRSNGTHKSSSSKASKAKSVLSTSKGPGDGETQTQTAEATVDEKREPAETSDEAEDQETQVPDAPEPAASVLSEDQAEKQEPEPNLLKSPSTASKRSTKSKLPSATPNTDTAETSAIEKEEMTTEPEKGPAPDADAQPNTTAEQANQPEPEADAQPKAPDTEPAQTSPSLITGLMASMGLSQTADAEETKENKAEEKSLNPVPSVAESKSVKAVPSTAESSSIKPVKSNSQLTKKPAEVKSPTTPSASKKGFLSKFAKGGKKKMKTKNSKDERSKSDDSKSHKGEKKSGREIKTKTSVPPPIKEDKVQEAPQTADAPNAQIDDAEKVTSETANPLGVTNGTMQTDARSTAPQEHDLPLMNTTLSSKLTTQSEIAGKTPIVFTRNSTNGSLSKNLTAPGNGDATDAEANVQNDVTTQEQANTGEPSNEVARDVQGETPTADETAADDVYSVAEKSMTYISDVASQVSNSVSQSLKNVQDALSPIVTRSSAQCGHDLNAVDGDTILNSVEAGLSTGIDKVEAGLTTGLETVGAGCSTGIKSVETGIQNAEVGMGGCTSGNTVSRSAPMGSDQIVKTPIKTKTYNVDGRVADTSDPENLNIFVTLPKKHMQRAVNVNIALIAARSSLLGSSSSQAESDIKYEGNGISSIARGLSRILTGKSEDEGENKNQVQSDAVPSTEAAVDEAGATGVVELAKSRSSKSQSSIQIKSKGSSTSKSLKQKLVGKNSGTSQV